MEPKPGNHPFELESLFLLRLPQDASNKLNDILLAGNLRDRLAINLHDDLRHGAVKLDGDSYSGKVWDLPCIIESQKTVDMKTFYKTGDLSHVLVCTPDPDLKEHESNVQQNSKHHYPRDRKFLWPHGITPPLKNVRKRRFRKTARKKYIDSPDIEKEVKRLLKADIESVSVKYEVVSEEKKEDDKMKSESNSSQLLETDELHKIFQDLSSSDSEKDEDVNIEDVDSSLDMIEIPSGIALVTNETERSRLSMKLEKLSNDLMELKKRKERKQQLLKGHISNEKLKNEFHGELEHILSRIDDTKRDIGLVKAKLGMR